MNTATGIATSPPSETTARAVPLRPLPGIVAWSGAAQVALLFACVPLFGALGLRIEGASALPYAIGFVFLASLWAFYRFARASAGAPIVAEVLLALILTLGLSNLLALYQYAAAALGGALIDPWLARADAMLGIHVPALAEWTRAHPWIDIGLQLSYFTLLPQFVLPFIFLGLFHRDFDSLWEYVFHYHFCAFVTLAALALFPAECAFLYYGFESTIDQTRFIHHFEGLRAGSFTRIDVQDLEGLISFPSFHTAGALMVTWAFRRHPTIWPALLVLNLALVAATFLSGAHYFVDVVVTVGMFGGSIATYRGLVGRFGGTRGD